MSDGTYRDVNGYLVRVTNTDQGYLIEYVNSGETHTITRR